MVPLFPSYFYEAHLRLVRLGMRETTATLNEKWSHFDLKVESLVELKFDPGFRII